MFFVGIGLFIYAQPYNNSWINYSQQYYKFKIAKTAIYRIDSTTLANSGIPLASINPQNFQLFARGVEVPIYIQGESDGVFDGNDFIEFYGQYNDGWFDDPLYGGAVNHANPYYSLFNDTICYYLTWNTSTSNNRLIHETDTSFSAYTPVNYFNKEVVQYYSTGFSAGGVNYYYDGETNPVGNTLFGFAPTEGWFDDDYTLGASKTKSIPTKNVYTSGPNATLNAVVLGESDYASLSAGDHHLRVTVGTNVLDSIFEGYKKIDIQMNISIGNIGTNTTSVVSASINDLGSGADRQALAFIKINYPHTLDMEGLNTFQGLFLDDHPTESKSYLNFSNFNGGGNVIFYELTSGRRIDVINSGTNYKCLIPNTGATKECYIAANSQVQMITSLTAINGTGNFVDYATQPVDTAFIIITHPTLMTEANNYANYRLNPPLNGLNVDPQNAVVYNIEDLYDQFAYGIEKHPYSIRGFIDYIADNWPTQPNYLFLVGKAIKSKESRKDPNLFYSNLVPSYGEPTSDIMLTAGLNGTSYEPLIPTGRLAAKTGLEVDWYLNKVMEHENPVIGSAGETDWMKRILHFGGGTSTSESVTFMSYLNNFKTTIEDTLFGGNVVSFSKSSTAPIQNILSDSIKGYIGQGVAMMTFFGHASATGGFDQNIDDPSTWPNQNGKYPFVVGLACHAGDVHLASANSTSEDYVIADNKGAIAFFSSVDLGVAGYLNVYADVFYKNLAYLNYKGSIGRTIKNTIVSTQAASTTVYDYRNSTSLSMTLHGDPSLSLDGFDKPDYMIEASTVTFNPSIVTSDLDSFDINVLVTNLGKAIDTTIVLEVVRSFPNQTFADTVYSQAFSAPHYQQIISFRMPVDVVKGLGINNFTITVDAVNVVDEIYENNNTITKTLNILSGEIIPIYPYQFMIVPDQGVTLKASTAFPFEPAKDYVFEVDTTDYFNSPIKETTLINHVGGVVSWSPTLLQTMPDSTVYFWRVSKDSVDATGYSWRGRSFQYIQGREGWEQDHFFQFENDGVQFVKHNRPTRLWDFVSNVKQLKGTTSGKADWSELNNLAYYIDASVKAQNGNGTNCALHVAVLDSLTLEPWSAEDINVGQLNVPGSPINDPGKEHMFIFRHNSPTQMAALENFLVNIVPANDYIIMWTWYIVNLSSYVSTPASLKLELGNMGATQIPALPDKYPFIFFTKKGNPASTIEVVGDSIDHKNLVLSTTLTTSANYANIYSEVLGPATRWDSLSWRMKPIEFPTTKDSSILNVYGVDASGNETLISTLNNLPTDSGDIRINDDIDASVYPYLKLNAFLSDDSLFTAPQLDRWQVIYSGVPEAALDPGIYFSFQNDTVEEGQDITVSIAVKNISRYDMDSLLISFEVLDRNNNLHTQPYPRQKPLLSDSVIIATLTFPTNGLAGLNSLLIDVNPNNDQLEMYHFNNIAQIPFYVNPDKINPILDVTFDGIHILDGDIVSPKSEIVMELTDENPYLILNDTSDYAVYITSPNGVEERVYFYMGGAEIMQFIPASLPKNNSKIIYHGNFPTDGEYKLRVQASDRSDNSSGSFDYIIGFEVINKSTITNVLNYPNPFTTSTRFVFTLTGSEIPDIFKIQIMTITGKVVREIHKDELGPINIGRNITEFAWDGTDTYGDRLANGLYLYRIVTQINSDQIEHRETSADSYFKKGYGKMYLFR